MLKKHCKNWLDSINTGSASLRQNELYTFKTELFVKMTDFENERFYCQGQDDWRYEDPSPVSEEQLKNRTYQIPKQTELDEDRARYTGSQLVERFISIMQRAKGQEQP